MPPIFKTLANITVWTLWVGSWVLLLSTLVMGFVRGQLFSAEAVPPFSYVMFFGLAMVCAILSVCAMKLRKMLE